MKVINKFLIFLLILSFLGFISAEDKFSTDIVPKLTEQDTKDAPELAEGMVYPSWGVPCMNFTYFVMYKDKQNRPPQYVRINLNGKWYDMQKQSGEDYTKGVMYNYNVIPDSGKQLFYYYEASNGVGKARDAIIDTPDQGPVLFSEKLDNNQIILVDKNGKELWTYNTGRDWVEGISLSDNGDLAAVTNFNIYLFSRESNTPLWKYCTQCEVPALVNGQMQGVAISGDGNYIAGTLNSEVYYFSKESNTPLWHTNIESGVIGLDISQDGSYVAVGTSNSGEKGDRFFLFDKQGNKLIEYKAEHPDYIQTGNFYKPDMTPDGSYTAVSTGCPDRRAYLFSKTGLIFRSEQLTTDSPAHKSAISNDGSLIAYSADHNTGKEIVFLFNNLGKKIWSFSSSEDSTARAVSISGNGEYIAAGTSAGRVYLFSKDSNKPLWKFTETKEYAQFGDVKLNSDGSLLAVGGTSKKIYLFSKDSNKPLWSYDANTWITKLDFNGEYIAAGTGPREYFFEGRSLSDAKVTCNEIIQPPARELSRGGEPIESLCGNKICEESSETKESCPSDCNPEYSGEKLSSLGGNSLCGNKICEPPYEKEDNCCEDCRPNGCNGNESNSQQEKINNEESENTDKNIFQRIIDFFKNLF